MDPSYITWTKVELDVELIWVWLAEAALKEFCLLESPLDPTW